MDVNKLMNKLPWDVKSTLDKVKNAVLNYTEMEAKVREATNNGNHESLLTIPRGLHNLIMM
jgi:epsin